jgi:hypothetical protein
MSGSAAAALLLLSIGLLDGALGPRGLQLRSLLALLAFAPVLVHLIRGCDWRAGRGVALGATGVACALLWHFASGAPQYFSLAAALALLTIAQGPGEETRRELGATLALTALAYAAFVVVRDFGSLWPVLFPLSESVSSLLASAFGVSVRLGPSHSGMWLVAAFVLAFAARRAVARPRSARLAALAVALVVVLPSTWFGLRTLGHPAMAIGLPPQLLTGRFTEFLLLLVPLRVFTRAYPLPSSSSRPGSTRGSGALGRFRDKWFGGRRGPAVASAVLLIVGIALLSWSPGIPAKAGRVLLDARGNFSLEGLRWGEYGSQVPSGASLAALPPYLKARGFTITVHESSIDTSILADHDVMVVMNPGYTFDGPELEAIWGFVEDGGGLLVLADHTNIQGTMEPLNTLLEPSGVQVEFDSAIPQITGWTWYGCMRIHPHPLTRGIRDESDVKTSVGASLALPRGAMPLLTGREAFSDAGDWENERGAYLGNMRYDSSETFGDLPLAAVAYHGRGKVVVFGDTSPFQRGSLYSTHEFIARVFTYLATPDAGAPSAPVRTAGAVALTLGALGLLLAGAAGLPVVAVVGVLATATLLTTAAVGRVEYPEITAETELAWLDLAHGNRLDTHTGKPNGIAAFVDHLWRSEYLPLAMKTFNETDLQSASIFATVAPSIPFSAAERRALVDYVEGGGLLVVASGYEESSGAEALLSDFGYQIGSTPIGAAHQVQVHLEGQHVMMHESWPVLGPEGRGEVWVSCWGFPLITFEVIGRGGLLVIGDSFFLCDVKRETKELVVEDNINFLRAALETAQQRMAGGGP